LDELERLDRAFDPSTDESQLDLRQYLAKLPADLGEVYVRYFDLWSKTEWTLVWNRTGFSLRVPVRGIMTTMADANPERGVCLSPLKIRNEPMWREPYQRYLATVKRLPDVREKLDDDKNVYLSHDRLTADGLDLLLRAASILAYEVSDDKPDVLAGLVDGEDGDAD